jgi:hypothetical protein
MILDEVHLILRLLRRYVPARFPALIAEIRGADFSTPLWEGVAVQAAE